MTTPGEPFLNMFRRPAPDNAHGTPHPEGNPPTRESLPTPPRRAAPPAVTSPAQAMVYPRSEQRQDLRHARADARVGRPDVDAAEAWTSYLAGLVETFRQQAVSAYLSMLQRLEDTRRASAGIRSELGDVRVLAERAARRAEEAQANGHVPTATPTTRDERIRARRVARARAATLACLDSEARTSASAAAQMQTRLAEAAEARRAAEDALRAEWDLLAGHTLRRLYTYSRQLIRSHPDGDRMQVALHDAIEAAVATLRERLEELLIVEDPHMLPGRPPAGGGSEPAVEAG